VGTYAVEYVRQKHRGKWDIKYAVERACKSAACVIQKVGCQGAIPWGDELDQNKQTPPVDVPNLEVPKVEVPIPNLEVPKVEAPIPNVELPNVVVQETALDLAQKQVGDIGLEDKVEQGN
jgi:hypothetical protein